MSDFLTGVTEKYDPQLLKGRIKNEGNVISCLFSDMLFLDEVVLNPSDFITKDGHFYFCLLKDLRNKGFYSLDEITVLSNSSDEVIAAYEERGGWETIQHQINIINVQNFDTYVDILYRENILLDMYSDGFNLFNPIYIQDKKIAPIKLLRKLSAEECIDWYESRLSEYGTGYSTKILEEEEVEEFSDEFIAECEEGVENGIPFESAGLDVNLETINCFPFLSRQVGGLLPGTLTMLGGFSSTGKSTWLITLMMALLAQDKKVLIISNEEDVRRFKIKFFIWSLGKYARYFKLSKKKFTSGQINDEDREQIKIVQEFWKDNFSNRLKIISIADADMSIVKKKIRENVLRHGYDVVLYDTFKMQEDDFSGNRQDLSLVRDSRELHKLAKKYNIIILASVQLAEYMKGKLFLDSSVLSGSKQIKEVLENLFLMRNMYEEEKDPSSKYYCRPFRYVNVGTNKEPKWVEEDYALDKMGVYKLLFVEKTRAGENSSDNGKAYILRYDGDHCIFREVAQARVRHGQIL